MVDLDSINLKDDDEDQQVIGGYRLPVGMGSPAVWDGRDQLAPRGGAMGATTANDAAQQVAQARPRLTIGQRLAGRIADDTPAPTATIPTSTASVPSAVSRGADMKMPPAPPANTNISDLIAKRAQLGTPTDRTAVDPKTGKPKYRMGIGQRLLGALGNFASGVTGGGPVKYIGPGATNRAYDIAEQTRKANLANVDTQISDQEKLAELNEKAYANVYRQALASGRIGELEARADKYSNAIDPNSIQQEAATGKWYGTSYGGERREVGAPKWAPENKPSTILDAAGDRTKLADQMGLTGHARQLYIMTGKTSEELRQPRQPTELEIWREQFRKDNGRLPTADEIANRRARTRGTPAQFARVEADKQKALRAAEKQYREDKAAGDPDADKNLELAKQLAQEGYERQIVELGGSAGGQTPATRPPVAGAAQPRKPVQSIGGRKAGDVVNLKGKGRVRITQLFSDGTFKYDAAR